MKKHLSILVQAVAIAMALPGCNPVSHYLSDDRLVAHVYDRKTRKSCTLTKPVPAIGQYGGRFICIMHDVPVSSGDMADIMLASTIN